MPDTRARTHPAPPRPGTVATAIMRPGTAGGLPSYAIVTPAHNEAQHIGRTAASIVAQTHPPASWLIVDDGSADATGEVAGAFAAEHDWISVIDSGRDDPQPAPRNKMEGGVYYAPVIRAFNAGLAALEVPCEFVVKLDADLYLPPHYFEWVARTFAEIPRAGIVGGVIMEFDGRSWRRVRYNPSHVRGAIKAYRRACLDAIGGLRPAMGWDGIDEHAARARGWEVHVLSELPVLHYRPVGGKYGWRRARWEEGQSAHYMGYLPSYMLVRTVGRALVDQPPVVGTLVAAAGYGWSRLRRDPQVDDEPARREVRRAQRERLRALFAARGAGARQEGLPGGGPAFWPAACADGEGTRDPSPRLAPPPGDQ